MNFCERHGDALRDAIEGEGLSHLVAADADRAIANLEHELATGRQSLANFDPLMSACWAIIGRIAYGAPSVFFIDGCPLCWVADRHEETCHGAGCEVTRQTFEDWIPAVAALMRTEWEQLTAAEVAEVSPDSAGSPPIGEAG